MHAPGDNPNRDAEPYLAAPAANDFVYGVLHWLRIAQYRHRTILFSLAASCLLGGLYFALAPRYYQATAKLLIILRSNDQLAMVGEQDTLDNTMATHQELISSPVVIQGAIDQLLPEHRIDLYDTPPQFWNEVINERLSATTSRKTNFLQVAYRSLSPEAAAGVVSAIVQSYLGFVEGTHQGTASEVLDGLTKELTEVRRNLGVKQQELQVFRQQVGSLTVRTDDGIIHPTIQKALQLSEALTKAQEERLTLERQLEAIRRAVAGGGDLQPYLAALEASVGTQMMVSALGLSTEDLKLIGEQQQKLFESQQELQSLAPYYGPAHPKVVELNERIQATQAYLANYRANSGGRMAAFGSQELGPMLSSMLEQSVSQARRKEEQLSKSFQDARSQAVAESGGVVELESREREVKRLEKQQDVLLDRIANIDLRQLQAPIQATVVKEPLPEEKPVSPQLRLVVVVSLVGGLCVGGIIVYVQDVLDDRFASPEQMAAQLSVPVLAMVRQLVPIDGTGVETIHTHVHPTAVESEAFRTLRTALTLGAGDCGRILISSAEPGDGKTTVSANLAVSFAQAGKRTLVIDADLRKPGMTNRFGLKGTPGVADVLLAQESAAEVAPGMVRTTGLANLDVLPAGVRQPNPAELLSGLKFGELIAWAETCYDRVLVDCPPVLAVSDAQIVGRAVDGAILVVRPEKNHRRLVVRACESFGATGCTVLGVVANGLSVHSSNGYGCGYGYGDAYGYGEETDADADADEPTTLPIGASRNTSKQELPRRELRAA